MEAARRDCLVDEKARQMRARELDAGASSSRLDDVDKRTTEGADIVEDTTDGVPINDGAGSGESDPLACLIVGHPPACFIFLMHWGQFHAFLVGVG